MRIYLFTSATSHWNSHVHERSVTSSGHEGTPTWTEAKPSSSRRSHRKTYRLAEARIYHGCVELVIFIGRTVCIWNSACKHTAWSTSLSPRVADDAGLAQLDFTRPVSRKQGKSEGFDSCDRPSNLTLIDPHLEGDQLTSVTLIFDLWPWPFAWTLLWSLVITPEHLMMIR